MGRQTSDLKQGLTMTDYDNLRAEIRNLEKLRDDLASRISIGCEQKNMLTDLHARVCKALRALYGQ